MERGVPQCARLPTLVLANVCSKADVWRRQRTARVCRVRAAAYEGGIWE